jgi:hypothetical protein
VCGSPVFEGFLEGATLAFKITVAWRALPASRNLPSVAYSSQYDAPPSSTLEHLSGGSDLRWRCARRWTPRAAREPGPARRCVLGHYFYFLVAVRRQSRVGYMSFYLVSSLLWVSH